MRLGQSPPSQQSPNMLINTQARLEATVRSEWVTFACRGPGLTADRRHPSTGRIQQGGRRQGPPKKKARATSKGHQPPRLSATCGSVLVWYSFCLLLAAWSCGQEATSHQFPPTAIFQPAGMRGRLVLRPIFTGASLRGWPQHQRTLTHTKHRMSATEARTQTAKPKIATE